MELHAPLETGEAVPEHVAEQLGIEDGDAVVWFFPNSAGCRCGTQAQQLATLAREQDVQTFGVADSKPTELADMHERLELDGITLVSDEQGDLASEFGVEHNSQGFERRMFFIRGGRVRDVSDGVASAALEQAPECPPWGDAVLARLSAAQELASEQPTLAQSESDENRLHTKLEHPGVYVVTGRRGAGKSAAAMQIAEKMGERDRIKKVAVGTPEQVKDSYPGDWHHVEKLSDAPPESVVTIDESYMTYNAREAMTEENKELAGLVNTSRHCMHSILFVTQNSRILDVNAVSEADGILIKKPGALHKKFERREVKELTDEAEFAFNQLPNDLDHRAYGYLYTNDFQGMVRNDKPDWYTDDVSRSYAYECETARPVESTPTGCGLDLS